MNLQVGPLIPPYRTPFGTPCRALIDPLKEPSEGQAFPDQGGVYANCDGATQVEDPWVAQRAQSTYRVECRV